MHRGIIGFGNIAAARRGPMTAAPLLDPPWLSGRR